MINDNIKEEIKKHLKDYLDEKGITTKKLFTCLNPKHNDQHPSMSYDNKKNIVHCFSCNTSYDLINLYALDNKLDSKLDFKKIIEELAVKYGIDLNIKQYEKKTTYVKRDNKEDFTRYYNKCKKEIDKTDYLEIKRGISKKLIDKYNIGYDTTKRMIVFPISKTCYEGRSIEENNPIKHVKPKGINNEIFNLQYIKTSDFKSVVWVCESIIDAMSLEEVKEDIKSISLNSINNSRQLVEEIKKSNYKGSIVLALDTDNQGIRTSQELQEELELLGIQTFIFNADNTSYGQDIKDINEYLMKKKEQLKNGIEYFDNALTNMLETKAREKYEKENVLNYLDIFSKNIQDQERNKPTSTGIKRLDEALEGGFYRKNLVIIGAISSLGKTTLALQIGDNIAKQGKDVLIFSLEMAKEELIAKSLSRGVFLEAKERNIATYTCLTTREILRGKGLVQDQVNGKERVELYNGALEKYKQLANNIYITECSEKMEINITTIEEQIKNHIAITGNNPFVIIDYLQIIQNQEKGLTDKQAIDKLVVNLKRIARDNDVTILLVSAFNRASYNKESGLDSFRDSSTIEYTADVLISLQHEKLDGITGKDKEVNINQEQQKSERELTLKILKNRNGAIKDVKHITFYAKYNYMEFKEYDSNFRRYED